MKPTLPRVVDAGRSAFGKKFPCNLALKRMADDDGPHMETVLLTKVLLRRCERSCNVDPTVAAG